MAQGEVVKRSILFPVELYRELRYRAVDNDRTVQAEVIELLQRAVREWPREGVKE
jgi:plasmid stability protein